jgi:hypothetical protein
MEKPSEPGALSSFRGLTTSYTSLSSKYLSKNPTPMELNERPSSFGLQLNYYEFKVDYKIAQCAPLFL